MIDREQLAGALERLHPRDREVLDLSLRRRVPDGDLAELLGTDSPGVARLRAAAVERLSGELGVERGEDLGQMLRELLEPETWSLVPRAEPAAVASAEESRKDDSPEAADGDGAEPEPHPPVGTQVDRPSPSDSPAPEAGEASPSAGSDEPATKEEPSSDRYREPVLGMLSGRPRPNGDDWRAPSRARRFGTAALLAIAVLVPAGMIAALTSGNADESGDPGDSATRPFSPERQAIGDPFPSDPQSVDRFPIAVVTSRAWLLDRPSGRRKVRIPAKTEWGSARVLSVVRREGDWLAVLVPELENGDVGWIRDDQVSRLDAVSWSLHADLSSRRLLVRQDGKVIRRVKIGIGRRNHPTPTGRFAVTDKLRVNSPDSPYGCCVLALTGHQTKLPAGWPGGDRLAVHATRDRGGLGRAVSLGCMRADSADARWMMRTVPLGSPVFIRQ